MTQITDSDSRGAVLTGMAPTPWAVTPHRLIAGSTRARCGVVAAEPLHLRAVTDEGACRAWWPTGEGIEMGITLAITEDMDWANQIHVGRRFVQAARVTPPTAEVHHDR